MPGPHCRIVYHYVVFAKQPFMPCVTDLHPENAETREISRSAGLIVHLPLEWWPIMSRHGGLDQKETV
ncbi:hypothetical protein PsasTeo6_20152 [Pseudomonas asiatica]|nr:hypothetical protein PsasTeo6_20152 [Pseudomonas asiatica]